MLRFTSSGLTLADSSNVTVTVGAATQLAITTQPVGAASGAALGTQPVVAIRDAQGNTRTGDSGTQVTVAIQSGAGGTLGGTTTVTASSGVVTFTNLTLAGTVGTSYVLRFTSSGLTLADSSNVTIGSGVATQLALTTQPVGAASGAVLATQPAITIRDAVGNTVTSDNSTQVTVAIQSGAGGALGGTTTVTASSGVVTFTNLTLAGTVGTNYVLRFTGGGLTLADSSNVGVTPGAAPQLAITAQPLGASSATALATQPMVVIRDAQGNTRTGDSSTQVTVAIQSGAGGTLGGTTTVAASNGVVTFTNLTLAGTVGTSYVLRFTSSGLTLADSSNVTVTPGSASHLGIMTQPVGALSGTTLAAQPIVAILDMQGNPITSDNSTQVMVTIQAGNGGALGGSTLVTAAGGVATFTDLTLAGVAGQSYVLRFTSNLVTGADSTGVTVTVHDEPATDEAPVAPSAPSEPAGPSAPSTPSAPSEPLAPSGPSAPAAPGSPVATEIGNVTSLPPQTSDIQLSSSSATVVSSSAVATNSSGLASNAMSPAAAAAGPTSEPTAVISLSVPPGAIPDATQVTVQAVSDLATLSVVAPTPSVDVSIVSAMVAVATERQNNDIKDVFTQSVQMTVSLPSTSVAAGAASGDFVVAFWDVSGGGWVPLDDASVTAVVAPDGSVTVVADLPHFTMYAVLFQSSRLAAEQASSVRGTFASKPIFSSGGQALSILQGGTVDQLEIATRSIGASGVWVQDSTGAFQLLLVSGPSFLKDSFRLKFPTGFVGSTSVLLVR